MQNKIKRNLRRKQKVLWQEFSSVQRKDSFSGLRLADELDKVQEKMDKLGMKGARHVCSISIEVS